MFIRILKWLFGTPEQVDPPDGGVSPSSTVSRDYSLPTSAQPPGTPSVSDQLAGSQFPTNLAGNPDVAFRGYPDDQGAVAGSQPAATLLVPSAPIPSAPVRHVPVPGVQPAGTTSTPVASELGGLDTEKFAPLTRDEAMEQTRSVDWKNAYWDSLRVIPPADMPRIRVIDGTMVGMGLITSEELAEIHDVGVQMDRYQNHAAFVNAAASQAVDASRQARQQLKQQKKEEAAARRKQRQAEIAERKATDIVFLGRGVSKGLADRRSNVERLEANKLPLLSSPADLAKALEISIPKLRWLAWHSEAPSRVHYFYFTVPKKSGGERQLSAPHQQLADVQQWVLSNVLSKLVVHDCAHGFVPTRSVVSNAVPHVGASTLVNVDLKDFFPSISFPRVDGLFRAMGYSPAVATILALLCTECPRKKLSLQGMPYYAATGPRSLPQGACTSPAISNLICRNLDHRLSGMASRLNWNYTRYADDISWSCQGEAQPSVGYVLARIRHIADDEGFELNHKKTRVLKPCQRQSVTGVVVNEKTSVPRKTIRRIRAILHNAKRTGLEAQNTEGHPDFQNWLRGMIAWIRMVNPDQGARLEMQFLDLMPNL